MCSWTSNSSNYPVFNDGPLAAVRPKGGYDGFVTRMSLGGNFVGPLDQEHACLRVTLAERDEDR